MSGRKYKSDPRARRPGTKVERDLAPGWGVKEGIGDQDKF